MHSIGLMGLIGPMGLIGLMGLQYGYIVLISSGIVGKAPQNQKNGVDVC